MRDDAHPGNLLTICVGTRLIAAWNWALPLVRSPYRSFRLRAVIAAKPACRSFRLFSTGRRSYAYAGNSPKAHARHLLPALNPACVSHPQRQRLELLRLVDRLVYQLGWVAGIHQRIGPFKTSVEGASERVQLSNSMSATRVLWSADSSSTRRLPSNNPFLLFRFVATVVLGIKRTT